MKDLYYYFLLMGHLTNLGVSFDLALWVENETEAYLDTESY